jgi:calcium-translocating P-type ATPase
MTEIAVGGLSSKAAAARLAAQGANELPRARPTPAWRRMAAQLLHFFALLLWVAGGLAIAAGMVELGVAIFMVIVVNGLFAFVQEHRAERAAQQLNALLPCRAVVVRDERPIEISAADVVEGDVVVLSAGDRVPADVRVTSGRGLLVDASTLTGESVPVGVVENEPAFAGTFVVEGEARAVVVATGLRTRLASIAMLTRGRLRPRTPLTREIDRLVRIVAAIALAVGTLFFVSGALMGLPLRDGFLFAIGVAVALVPEGLLPTVTLSLAMGASRMAKRGALVRRLEAVETLGSTTFICSDKTGTLTTNEMSVVELWTPAGTGKVRGTGYSPAALVEMNPDVRAASLELAVAGARASSGRAIARNGTWIARGDPMEAALHAFALRLGVDLPRAEANEPELGRFSFDPHRRRMSVVVRGRAFVKGAPDAVLPLCRDTLGAESVADEMTGRGFRVLAVARRHWGEELPARAEEVESELELLGLVGFLDPPRPEVRQALHTCRQAGIRVAVITGDHPRTARAVAAEIGLDVGLVVTGAELPTDEALLGALMDRDGVLACRVSPEQKLLIAKALQARGHVVAMTGDGVNDGPALQQADIGIAMGRSGTDVAREAADLVLLDDRFETIVDAIEQGRATFANIRRFLTYHLTDNVSELAPFVAWALTGGRFPLALGVLQILCLDLLTDQLPAVALGAEPPSPRTLEERPHQRHLVDKDLLFRAFVVLGPTEALVELVAFAATLVSLGWRPGGPPPTPGALAVASGAAFTAIVAGQFATALACRSWSRPGWQVGLRKNRLLLGALLVTLAVVASLLSVPALAALLGHALPSPLGFGLAALAFPAVLLADAAHKLWLRRAQRFRTA